MGARGINLMRIPQGVRVVQRTRSECFEFDRQEDLVNGWNNIFVDKGSSLILGDRLN